MSYLLRAVDAELDDLMPSLPAIALDGPKGVGKTATAARRAATVLRLDHAGDREVVAADLTQLDRGPGTVLVDEWQRLPAVWDHVRRQVDDGAPPGRYLLTGSAAPVDAPVHSGAGRIVSLRMRPMSLAERGLTTPSVSLAGLLSGSQPAIEGRSEVTLMDYLEEVVASGLPGIRPLPARARRAALGGYLDRVVERDFPQQGLRVRRPDALRAWLAAYARATSSTASYTTLVAAAASSEGDHPTRGTTYGYRDVLTQLWLLDPVPAWVPVRPVFPAGARTKLGSAPKHHLADPALAASLLGLDAAAVLRSGRLLGALFESLVTLGVRVHAQAAEARVRHLRLHNGTHEVDLVVERADGRVLAVEVKLSATVDDADVAHLRWLRNAIGDDLLDAAVLTTGTHAYRRPDGIAVVPAALLGA